MDGGLRKVTAAALAGLQLCLAGCSAGTSPGAARDKAAALQKEADEQRQMHDREAHNR